MANNINELNGDNENTGTANTTDSLCIENDHSKTSLISVSAPERRELTAPRVFDYDNYREFLSDWFSWKKSSSPSYSGAVFARKAGLSAHTLLGMTVRGQRNLSHDTIRAFTRALELKTREALFFEKLVLFNQSRSGEDKAYYLEQLLSVSQGNGKRLLTKIKNHARYFSNWYVVAIKELVACEGFNADPEWIVERLKNKISRKQAQEAFTLLLDLGMLKEEISKDGQNKFLVVHPSLDIDPGHVDFAVRNFHRDFLDRSKRAIDEESMDERELSSLTMPVTEEDLPLLRAKIKEFRKNLNLQFPVSKNSPRKHVVAINMQFLVLTKTENRKTEEK